MRISDIELRRPFSRNVRPLDRVVGLDTETKSDGNILLVCDSDGQHVWVKTWEDLLPVILSGNRYVCYNLDFDASAILKCFGEEFCKALLGGATQQRFEDIDVWYAPGKFLSFTDGKARTILWDVAQYFMSGWSHISLRDAAKLVGMRKLDFPVKGLDDSFYGNSQLLEYCTQDAKITCKLAELIISTLKSIGVEVSTLASIASIMEAYVMDFTRNWIPDVIDIPLEALQYGEDAYQPPWRDFYMRGSWDRAFKYDIVSAYPSKARSLLDVTEGRWEYFKGRPSDKYLYAYTKCDLDLPEALSWLACEVGNAGLRNCPYGEVQRTLTLNGLRYLPKGAKIVCIDGWGFIPSGYPKFAYRKALDRLLKVKADSPKGSLQRDLAKLLTSSLHGKFRQVNYDRYTGEPAAGRLFMPNYEAEVGTDVKLQVYLLARQLPPEILIGVHTDCIYTSDSLDMPLGKEVGDWDLSTIGSFLVIGANAFGFGNGWYRKALEDQPEAVKYPKLGYPRNRPYSLQEALAQESFSEACSFHPVRDEIDIRKQLLYKRLWLGIPKRGEDLLRNVYASRQCYSAEFE